jgi:hypothetical protein
MKAYSYKGKRVFVIGRSGKTDVCVIKDDKGNRESGVPFSKLKDYVAPTPKPSASDEVSSGE